MCFSPEVDIVAAGVISVAAVDAARHVGERREIPIAALPALFAAHTVMSAFVWWGFQGVVSSDVGDVAAWLFMLLAFSLFPGYVPWAIYALEPEGPRRRRMLVIALIGTFVCVVFFVRLVLGEGADSPAGHYIDYRIDATDDWFLAIGYIIATCGAMLLSGERVLVIYGWVNTLAVVLLALFQEAGFASLWCFWAAITSGLVALYLRRRRGQEARSRGQPAATSAA